MRHGIRNDELNHIYPPTLSNTSDLPEFQAYLHLCFPGRCPRPCKATGAQADFSAFGVLECPGEEEDRAD